MKMLGWMQNKLNARFACNSLHSISLNHHPPRQHIRPKEEFSDWPQALLAIGTFGNTKNNVKQEQEQEKEKQEEQEQEEVEVEEFTADEVEKIEKELNLLLEDDKSLVIGGGEGEGERKAINNNVANSIKKKSFSFLLKKMFVSRPEFTPKLNLRDQLPQSTMEKILRAILHKKIYPQNPNSTNSSTKKVLHKKHKEETKDNGSKWVKTDSEYIVLEI
ncbi:protein NEGATIVE GRAVITROPIC RESPONSE OF ROOTS [Euphorbia lathyris]|uniref:protein NEGATIVE GRAVITROPIC RESPONSE OF ROOTS n=1 Tax=Euphorbia lathyris TaxID=212925 RepID=UPI0033140C86